MARHSAKLINHYVAMGRLDIAERMREHNRRCRAAERRYVREFRKRHPDRVRAMRAVKNALRRGELVRPSKCSRCDKDCIPQAHHHSYEPEDWLDVEWLCQECHHRRGVHSRSKTGVWLRPSVLPGSSDPVIACYYRYVEAVCEHQRLAAEFAATLERDGQADRSAVDAAAAAIAEIENSEEFIRVLDWIPQVREATKAGAEALVNWSKQKKRPTVR